jgi:hypothetical protein
LGLPPGKVRAARRTNAASWYRDDETGTTPPVMSAAVFRKSSDQIVTVKKSKSAFSGLVVEAADLKPFGQPTLHLPMLSRDRRAASREAQRQKDR